MPAADVLLAGLLSAVGDPAPPPLLPPPAPIVRPDVPPPLITPLVTPAPLPMPPAPLKTTPEPLVLSVPPEPPIARKRPAGAIVWQLFCQGDSKLYRHADKAYLERFVAERNALYATARTALTFQTAAPGWGYQPGQAQWPGSRGGLACFGSQ